MAALTASCRSGDQSLGDGLPTGGGRGPVQCPLPPGAPMPVAPLPSAPQVAYQRTELTAFLHFGLETFDGTEHGASNDSALLFNPTSLDAAEWVNALKDAGFGQANLVVKHDTGFCLWPSAYTDYSVKSSPWKGGDGDLVRDFTDAMHAAGMRVAFYVSPLDAHYPNTSPSYEAYFRNQLTELLTNYGPVAELYLPGNYSAPSIDWVGIWQLAKQLQPDLLVFTGPPLPAAGTDLRYLGSPLVQASRSTSSVAPIPDAGPANAWYPAEAPVSDRGLDWFWHPNGSVISLTSLQALFFHTVGMNSTVSLNVPPAMTGRFDAPDLDLLQQFGSWHRAAFKTNLARGQSVSADSTWSAPGFAGEKAVDDDICTFWTAARGATSARLEISLASGLPFSIISIREPIELGERTTAYHIEIKKDGTWDRSPSDLSGMVMAGTVIGQRQLWQVNPVTAEAVALVIDSAKAAPAIAELGLY